MLMLIDELMILALAKKAILAYYMTIAVCLGTHQPSLSEGMPSQTGM